MAKNQQQEVAPFGNTSFTANGGYTLTPPGVIRRPPAIAPALVYSHVSVSDAGVACYFKI